MAALTDLPAPAKVNLFLHVTGRRPDGYHLLQSVFMLIDWQDTLHLETRHDGQLRRHDLTVALPEQDLCLRAARLLQTQSATSLGCDIHIRKTIPWGAGMGGGSSDAATVLMALNQLWQLHWSRARLETLALQLGADVPFFVRGHNAWVEGTGEIITPIALPNDVLNTPLALLKPAVAVPTSVIFGSPDLKRDTPPVILPMFLASPRAFGRNDLQRPAEAYSQEVKTALSIMQQRFGNSRMTGSGSTVFSWVTAEHEATAQATPGLADKGFSPNAMGLDDSTWLAARAKALPQHPLLTALPPIA